MYTFIASAILLVVGYVAYGAIVERIFGIDASRPTPAQTRYDGVDYVPLPWWKIFCIQLLNIAGLGPIFGAIMGAVYGPAAFLWIVFGCIFGGAVHDYCAGMLSLRRGGESLPETIGQYMGKPFKQGIRVFTVLLMLQVGAVFIAGPAGLLAGFTPDFMTTTFWVAMIFAYYLLATLLPIDKLIGRVYPIFGAALILMAVGVLLSLIYFHPAIPEITQGAGNMRPDAEQYPIFPLMFISIACGAISGFHATQSPLMARCMKSEKLGRRIFFGAMIAEGLIALTWAAAAASFFGSVGGLQNFLAEHDSNAAAVVDVIVNTWMGRVGALVALVGVVVAPITSGDTALRSARLIVADIAGVGQRSVRSRLYITLPIFCAVALLLQVNFDIIWRYFAWSNQTLAACTLWAITVYFVQQKRFYWITLIPAVFMTLVCSTYLLIAPEGFALPSAIACTGGAVFTVAMLLIFIFRAKKLPSFPHFFGEKKI
ncbi:MAG: carbon starvation protein A [Prevotellaceae bacterium]|jgi:carbon starvation protein CstA|nr:carbon starvation protein A [Prevotellaceae bacterium]